MRPRESLIPLSAIIRRVHVVPDFKQAVAVHGFNGLAKLQKGNLFNFNRFHVSPFKH